MSTAQFNDRVWAAAPLQLLITNVSTMILPPMATELVDAGTDAWAAGTAYAYGDIVNSAGHFYWCVTPGGGNAGAAAPTHHDGDVTDGTLLWRYIHWSRNVVTLTNVEQAGHISIARGQAAVAQQGIVLYPYGTHNEGFGGPRPYSGAWYAISDQLAGRRLAISEG